jgi:hypothetical protein
MHSELIRTRFRSLDWLKHSASASYFDARQYETYYRSLKHVHPRREFHPELTAICLRFLESTISTNDQRVVTFLIEDELARPKTIHPEKTVLDEAHAAHPIGVQLLELTEPLTFDSLKKQYKRAVRRHHPDLGGRHEDMVQINDVYGHCHELLRFNSVRTAGQTDEEFETLLETWSHVRCYEDYRYVIGELLFFTSLDDWNLTEATRWLRSISSQKWQASSYASDPYRKIDLIKPSATLASRLVLAKTIDLAKEALDVARSGLEIAKSKRLSFGYYVKDAERIIKGKKRLQVRLNHQRQAENALRLGIIDEKRFKKIEERLSVKAEKTESKEHQCGQYIDEYGFLENLPIERQVVKKPLGGSLVPEPGYFETDLAQLSDDQQAEYFQAFSSQGSFSLIQKYAHVRLKSLLESTVLFPNDVDLEAVMREAKALASFSAGQGAYFGEVVGEAASHFHSLSENARQELSRLLRALKDKPPPSESFYGVTITIDQGNPFAPAISKDYLNLLKKPLSDLEHALRSGDMPETAEEIREREAWNRDLSAISTREMEKSQNAAFAATDYYKTKPARAVKVLETHCDRLLELGGSIIHVQELQLGYWVDRLTIALVYQKRWSEAKAWIERFLALPDRYRDRSCQSEQESLRKRLERCIRMGG